MDSGLNVGGNDYLGLFKVTSKFATVAASKQRKAKALNEWMLLSNASITQFHTISSLSKFGHQIAFLE